MSIPKIKVNNINTYSIPNVENVYIPRWMVTQPNVDYLLPPVVVNIGNPIINIPGCVKAHKDNKRHKNGVPIDKNLVENDDGQIDNPGNILYYMPTRTNQSDSYNVSLGVSATWSRPLDKDLQAQCKEAAAVQINMQRQLTANKRLDFELARLKNCGELKKAGVMFHPKSPYHSVCADVMLVQPAGVVVPHMHTFTPNEVKIEPPKEIEANGTAEDLGSYSIGNIKD